MLDRGPTFLHNRCAMPLLAASGSCWQIGDGSRIGAINLSRSRSIQIDEDDLREID